MRGEVNRGSRSDGTRMWSVESQRLDEVDRVRHKADSRDKVGHIERNNWLFIEMM